MASSGAEERLREGLAALAVADWERARSEFERAQEIEPSPDALRGLADVAEFQGEYERAIELKEEAFAAYRESGRPADAADVARWLAFMHATYAGSYSVASGWMGRAESLLADVEESAAHGWLILDRAPFSRDPSERERCATSALALARRYGDADLEFEAVALLGESYVASGRVEAGLELLDQAMAAITSGEISDHRAIGEIYCRLLSACEQAVDVKRAEEWVEAVDRHVVWTDFVRPTCRSHYGGVLVALGQWTEAEAELLAAIESFERGYRGDRVFPLMRLGELRVRQGRFEEAERLLEDLDWHPTARRATAAIALGRGELALAQELTELCLDGADPADPACGPALELLVTIQLSALDRAGAQRTRDRLAELATASGSARWTAAAEHAAGMVAIAVGDRAATAHLTRAIETFAELQLPLETAQCRLDLARALAEDRPEAAAHEGRLALKVFERLGAQADADAAAELMRSTGGGRRAWPRGQGELTKREEEVLGLLAEGLSNAAIAERLVISVRTAEHHVANVLGKLELRSRAEAAAYAVRREAQDK